MKIHHLGVDAPDNFIDGREGRLVEALSQAQSAGFTLAELSIPSLSVIINGELVSRRLETIRQCIAPFDLKYTVHAPGRTNLAFGRNFELEYKVLESSLRFAGAIGASVLVYHSGLQALDAARTGMASLPDEEELARGAEREIAGVAEVGADCG